MHYIIIAITLSIQITSIFNNNSQPNLEGKWVVIHIEFDNQVLKSKKNSCDKINLWKSGIMLTKEKGFQNLTYSYGLTGKLKINSLAYSAINECKGNSVILDFNFENIYIEHISNDTLIFTGDKNKMILVKEK